MATNQVSKTDVNKYTNRPPLKLLGALLHDTLERLLCVECVGFQSPHQLGRLHDFSQWISNHHARQCQSICRCQLTDHRLACSRRKTGHLPSRQLCAKAPVEETRSRCSISCPSACCTSDSKALAPTFYVEASEDVSDSCSQHVTVLHTCLKCVGLCLYGGATYPPHEVARPQDGMYATLVPLPQGAISKEHHPSSLAPVSFQRCHFIYDHLLGLVRVRSVRDHQTHQSSWRLPVQQTRLENKSSVVSKC